MTDEVNPPAFPNVEPRDPNFSNAQPGMTLRDWFAGQALNGMGTWCPCRGDGYAPSGEGAIQRAKAEWAYAQADAMLAARKAQP